MTDRKSPSTDMDKNLAHHSNFNASANLYLPSYIPLPSEQLSFSQNYLPSLTNARLSTVYNQLEYESGYPQHILYNPNGYSESFVNCYGLATQSGGISSSTFPPSSYVQTSLQQPLVQPTPHQTSQVSTNRQEKDRKRKRQPSPSLDLRLSRLKTIEDCIPCDDDEGHLIFNPQSNLTARYQITKLLGQGTFGKVVEAIDSVTKQRRAIKIIKSIKKYRDASRMEVKVLKTLELKDPLNLKHCIHLKDYFNYRNHICMVFELLSQSVFDYLKENKFIPFSISHIQSFAYQLLEAVDYLHELKLIHTDLKPENIMLVNNASRSMGENQKELIHTDIRLIDFGSAIFDSDYHSSIVSTRHYRAPEIILGIPWSFECDIWSIGCILVEFYIGTALFQTHDNLEHLAMMEIVLGKFPIRLLKRAKSADSYFINGKLNYPNVNTDGKSRRFVKKMKSLKELINPSTPLMHSFVNLIQLMLKFDTRERITAKDALSHPFFRVT